MSVAETSYLAYESILGKIGGRRLQVLSAIYDLGECCNVEIAARLNLEINKVTPRVKELREAGAVVLAKKDVGPAGRLVCFWRLATEQELAAFREKKRQSDVDVDAAKIACKKRQRAHSVSEAGRALAAHRYNKRSRKIGSQELLF